jgi:NAD(P)-dependent dehydrogenase (short-subunit alcohol dehydrogenase family)
VTFKGKTVVVTGAAAGIGQHIALRFAQEGARVVVGDVQPADATVQLLREAGADAEYVACDLTDEGTVCDFAAQARDLHGGRIDILVNNAGVNGDVQLVRDMPIDSWTHTLQVNLTGTMLVTREIIPTMIAGGGGCIVNIASNVARRGLPYRADYVASKWAVLGLTQTLALELVDDNIRVNAVCPGPVEGDRIEQIMESHAAAEGKDVADIRKAWAGDAPMRRFIKPSEVASVVRFLACDESSAMTGQALNVTGGFVMT